MKDLREEEGSLRVMRRPHRHEGRADSIPADRLRGPPGRPEEKNDERIENWNDEYQDDIESQGMPLIRQGQSNSPKVLEGVLGIGDFLMPNGLVTKAYQFLAIGCDDLWVHWGANRSGGRLGFLPGSETPAGTEWLKPGVPRDGFPTVMKEGRYAPDGSVWERTIYLHSLVVAVRPAFRLDQPICGTFAFKGKSCPIGQNFYRSQLKAVEAVVDGRRSRNMALAQFEMSSELVHGRNQYAWMAPKPALVGVFGEPGGPSIDFARFAKNLRASFKAGGAWASMPLPAIAAPSPMEVTRIPATESAKPVARASSTIDVTSGPDASREPSLPSIPSNEYDGDAGGPHSLDEVIFD